MMKIKNNKKSLINKITLSLAVLPALIWLVYDLITNVPPPNYFDFKNSMLSMSSQPELPGLVFLRLKGVKSIINLGDDKSNSSAFLKLLGFGNYLNIKIKDHYPPTGKQVVAFLSFVTDKKNLPVHIHCRAGKRRSALMEALYYYSVEGKTSMDSLKLTSGGNHISDTQLKWFKNFTKDNQPGWWFLNQGKPIISKKTEVSKTEV